MTQPQAPSVTIELVADPTVNYAVQQNAVTLIKRLRIENHGPVDLDQVMLTITTEPAFAHRWEHHLDRLPVGQSVDLGAVDLELAHDFLATQAEAVRGALHATLAQGDALLVEQRIPMDVLAYDQWNGTRAIPEILAAFVMPNHPDVERILQQAGEVLKSWTGDPSFQGYQARDPERVRLQVAAIYTAIAQRRIVYCGVPASFEQEGQKIRTPDRILENRLGNCLDLTTLFAACFEQAGLHPLLCVTSGHAFPGVWLEESSFADSVVDDAITLRKRVDLQEVILLEATLATDGHHADAVGAITAGRQHLDDPGRFIFCVDLHRARLSRIRPLPVRVRAGETFIATLEAAPVTTAPSPAPTLMPPPTAKTPATRLDRWKRKLLDLSLRNRLLNFQESKSTVPLLFPDLPSLENALAEGQQLEFHPRPQDWQATGRDLNVHLRRTGEDAEKALLLGEFANRRLRCDLESPELTRRLTEIYRSARSSLEENGANTLFLALGMLIWYETKSSTQPRRAPILLIPVELQRRSAQSGFTLRRRDDEAMVNVTLLELLRHDFNLQVDGLDPLPEDEAGIDVRQVLDRIRQAIVQIDRWDVLESAHIGLFSFTKFLMWRDLELRTADLTRNKLVASLIHFPNQPFPAATAFPQPEQLDDDYPLHETFTPVSADSSQLAAVYAAGEGKSFVLHGPPGTGKSQTITNIITHALAQGKRVLFVAEKMAALSVVQRRLEAVGMDPFCLELHSNKSRKAHVLAQLERSLKLARMRAPEEWATEAERLAGARRELNAYVQALHRSRQTGESFFDGVSRLVTLGAGPRVALEPQLLQTATGSDLARLRDKVRTLTAASRAAGHPTQHRWRSVGARNWSPQFRDQVDGAIAACRDALKRAEDAVRAVAGLFGLADAGWRLTELEALQAVAEATIQRTSFAPALLTTPDWAEAQEAIERWVTHGQERDRLRHELYARFTPQILQLDLDSLSAQRATSATSWFLPRWLTERRLVKTLQAVAKPGHAVRVTQLEQELALALTLRREEQAMASSGEQGRALFGRLWREGDAAWAELAAVAAWAGALRQAAAQIAGEDLARLSEMRQRWATLFAEHEEQVVSIYRPHLQRVTEAIEAVVRFQSVTRSLLDLPELQPTPRFIEEMDDRLADWQAHTGELRLWCAWRQERAEAIDQHLAPLVTAYEQGQIPLEQLESAFERSFYSGWVDQIMGAEEPLRRFSRESVEDRIAHFRVLDDRFVQLTIAELQARLSARIPRSEAEPSPSSEVGTLRRELQKRSRHMALRSLFQQTRNLLPRLKPCLLMSPISVAQYLDPAFPPFDLVIYDEASQVPTWDAVGAIARGTEVIIVGDPQQLPPTNFFARGENPDDEDIATEDLESILDDALALTIPEMHLRWHYRSRHESLIAFSNLHYYQNDLLSFPSPAGDSAVRLRRVAGRYDRSRTRTNQVEAESIVQEVANRLRSPQSAGQSLGIVTFNMSQQRLIEDLLDEARRRYPEIEPAFNSDLAEPVFVKNLENVQGDERDVILFSICYGPDADGKVSVHFGPLNRDGGHRRLNVAITRARQEVVVFTSLRPEQIDLTRTKATGVHHLRAFLEFAERGTRALREQVRFDRAADQPAPFVQHVRQVLEARGHRVQANVGSSGYRIDLAIEDPGVPGRFALGIIADGANYRMAGTARDREKLREAVLQTLGWRLHRVWATEWLQDPEAEVQRIEAALAAAQASPAAETPVQALHTVKAPVALQTLVEPPVVAKAAAPSLPVYEASQAQPPVAASQHDFYAPTAAAYLTRLIAEVIQEEGPISLSLLCQRTAPHFGIGRITARVEERIWNLVSAAKIRTTRAGDAVFLWPARHEPASYDQFRVYCGEGCFRRDAVDLPPEEIANAAAHVLREQIGLPFDDLVRELARLFGYQRIGQQVDRCLRAGIALLLQRGGAIEEDGYVHGRGETDR